jgi:hypothetical protein
MNNNEIEFKYKVIGFIVFIIICIGLYFCLFGSGGKENNTNKEPDDIELMSYAQTVLEDNLYKPDYSSYKGDYEFIGTGLRRKIEGKVNGEKFWMIIEFTDDTYEDYDLISLQIGNNKIY